jgi:hypothetical protein
MPGGSCSTLGKMKNGKAIKPEEKRADGTPKHKRQKDNIKIIFKK